MIFNKICGLKHPLLLTNHPDSTSQDKTKIYYEKGNCTVSNRNVNHNKLFR